MARVIETEVLERYARKLGLTEYDQQLIKEFYLLDELGFPHTREEYEIKRKERNENRKLLHSHA